MNVRLWGFWNLIIKLKYGWFFFNNTFTSQFNELFHDFFWISWLWSVPRLAPTITPFCLSFVSWKHFPYPTKILPVSISWILCIILPIELNIIYINFIHLLSLLRLWFQIAYYIIYCALLFIWPALHVWVLFLLIKFIT